MVITYHVLQLFSALYHNVQHFSSSHLVYTFSDTFVIPLTHNFVTNFSDIVGTQFSSATLIPTFRRANRLAIVHTCHVVTTFLSRSKSPNGIRAKYFAVRIFTALLYIALLAMLIPVQLHVIDINKHSQLHIRCMPFDNPEGNISSLHLLFHDLVLSSSFPVSINFGYLDKKSVALMYLKRSGDISHYFCAFAAFCAENNA